MDGPAAVTELGREGLGLIDRRLRALELFTILNHDAGLSELRLQRLHVRLGHGRQGWTTNEEAVGDAARDHGTTEQEGQPALHEADATVSPGTCLATPPPRSRAASTSGEADSDRRRPEGT